MFSSFGEQLHFLDALVATYVRNTLEVNKAELS